MSPLSIAALIDASPSQKQMRPVAFAAPFFVGLTLLSMKLVSGLVTSSVSADAIESLRVITQPDAQIARAATAMRVFIFLFAFFSVDLSMRPDNATHVAPQTRTSLDRFSTIIPFSAITCTRSASQHRMVWANSVVKWGLSPAQRAGCVPALPQYLKGSELIDTVLLIQHLMPACTPALATSVCRDRFLRQAPSPPAASCSNARNGRGS